MREVVNRFVFVPVLGSETLLVCFCFFFIQVPAILPLLPRQGPPQKNEGDQGHE